MSYKTNQDETYRYKGCFPQPAGLLVAIACGPGCATAQLHGKNGLNVLPVRSALTWPRFGIHTRDTTNLKPAVALSRLNSETVWSIDTSVSNPQSTHLQVLNGTLQILNLLSLEDMKSYHFHREKAQTMLSGPKEMSMWSPPTPVLHVFSIYVYIYNIIYICKYRERKIKVFHVTCCYILLHAWWICGLAKDSIYTPNWGSKTRSSAIRCFSSRSESRLVAACIRSHQKRCPQRNTKIHKGFIKVFNSISSTDGLVMACLSRLIMVWLWKCSFTLWTRGI